MKLFDKRTLLGICLLFPVLSFAQSKKYTVSGTLKDGVTGETLIGALIRVAELPSEGATTNEYGFYSLTLPQGNYTFIAGYSGYTADTFKINLEQDQFIDISLKTNLQAIEEVKITDIKENDNITNAQTGVERIDMAEINKIPVIFGERDILKTIQLLPGIKSSGEGSSGFHVRGGAADQNLILLDEAPVYNASHLLGFFSTFNSDAIKDATIYKGTQPAQFGGRLASVLDIRMKEGNKQKYEVNGSLGLISAKLSVEGPIVKEKGSFFVSGRRTYADLFLKLSNDEDIRSTQLYFYDINVKANYKIGKKDVLYLSGYFGRDKLGLGNQFGIDWGNGTATLRWNHIVNKKLFSNTSAIFSNYDYVISIQNGSNNFEITSRIQDYNIKQEFQYFLSSKHTIRMGVNAMVHNILPGEVSLTGATTINNQLQRRYSWENGIYVSDEWKAASWVNINIGFRMSTFSVIGKGDFYTLDANRNVSDTNSFAPGEFVITYVNPEPRFSASFVLNDKISLKAAYGRNTQYLHLISNSTSTNPTDKWIPTNNNIKPEIADQVSLGYFMNIHQNMFEFGVEGYYKHMLNQVDYKDGANVLFNDAIETQLLNGTGRAYGVELFFKKKKGKFTGWISYTLSRTEKFIEGINKNNWYPARHDRTHDIAVVLSYDISKRINVSATFVYNTGNAVTFPSGKYFINDEIIWLYTERNGYRMPDYHRLDIGATYKFKERKHFSSEIAVSIYNVYARQNAYLITFQENEADPSKTDAVQTALFSIIPSISWNFKIK